MQKNFITQKIQMQKECLRPFSNILKTKLSDITNSEGEHSACLCYYTTLTCLQHMPPRKFVWLIIKYSYGTSVRGMT